MDQHCCIRFYYSIYRLTYFSSLFAKNKTKHVLIVVYQYSLCRFVQWMNFAAWIIIEKKTDIACEVVFRKSFEMNACSMFDNINKTCLEIDKFAANMKGQVWSIHSVSPPAIPWHKIEACDWGLLLKGESNKHVCRDVILRHQSLHFESIEKAQCVIVFTHFWWNVIEWNNKQRGKGAKKELSKQTNKQANVIFKTLIRTQDVCVIIHNGLCQSAVITWREHLVWHHAETSKIILFIWFIVVSTKCLYYINVHR